MGQAASWISVPILHVPSLSKWDDRKSSSSRSSFSLRSVFRKLNSDSDRVSLLPNIEEEKQFGDLRFRIKGLEEQLSCANGKIFENERLIEQLRETQQDPELQSHFALMNVELSEIRARNRTLELETIRLEADKQDVEKKLQQVQEQKVRVEQELSSQQASTEKVCQEMASLLEQVQKSSQEDNSLKEREQLQESNQQLKEQVAYWKCKYSKVKTQLRQFRANTSFFTQSMMEDLKTEDSPFLSPKGQIDDINVTLFQMSIDEVLVTARGLHASEVLDSVKGVASAVHGLNKNLDAASSSNNPDQLAKLRIRMSATANNLATAAKNYVTARGLSPVSLLDAAASHLTATVIEIIKIAGIRPTSFPPEQETSSGEEEETDLSPSSSKCECPVTPPPSIRSNSPLSERSLLRSKSLDSRRYDPKPKVQVLDRSLSLRTGKFRKDFNKRPSPLNLGQNPSRELKTFLAGQTFSIVDIAKHLLSQIRGDTDIQGLLTYINPTMHIVFGIVEKTSSTMEGNRSFSQMFCSMQGEKIVRRLSSLGKRLEEIKCFANESRDSTADGMYKQELAGVVSDIMKTIKA